MTPTLLTLTPLPDPNRPFPPQYPKRPARPARAGSGMRVTTSGSMHVGRALAGRPLHANPPAV